MIELEPPGIPADICLTSIECAVNMLNAKRERDSGRVFFVCFTSEHRLFERSEECTIKHGYNAVFFQPKGDLPTPYAWDIVMYSNKTGEALARIQMRPTW